MGMGTRPLELIAEAIRLLAAQDAHDLTDDMLVRQTEALLMAEDKLDGIMARRMQVMDVRNVTAFECGRALRGWLVETQMRSDVDADRRTSVARALPDRPVIEAALVDGQISLEHAARIISLIKSSPEDLRDVIEKELVAAARFCDPTKLGRFCRDLKAHLGTGENAEERDSRHHAGRWLRVTPTFDGMRRIDGMLDPTSAATIETALHALAPKGGTEDTRTPAQRNADALTMMATFALTHADTTDNGGEAANVMVLAPLDTLRDQLDHAGLTPATINGEPVSAATVRRLACDAGIIPAVLGSASEVLDLGRKTSTWSVAQRRALKIESRGYCGWPQCQVPVQLCQAHHINWWSHGGHTTTKTGVYICHFHHWLTHHSTWRIAKDPNGKIRVWRE
jgi:hypothetical protein